MGKKMVQKLTHFMEIPVSDIHKKCAELKVKSHSLDNMNKLTVALKINPTKQGKRKLAGIVFAYTYNTKRQELREIQNSNNVRFEHYYKLSFFVCVS